MNAEWTDKGLRVDDLDAWYAAIKDRHEYLWRLITDLRPCIVVDGHLFAFEQKDGHSATYFCQRCLQRVEVKEAR